MDEAKAEGKAEQGSGLNLNLNSPQPPISPVARRLAEEAGLDWQALAGTGPRGQITREDVEAALEQRSGGAEGRRSG